MRSIQFIILTIQLSGINYIHSVVQTIPTIYFHNFLITLNRNSIPIKQ